MSSGPQELDKFEVLRELMLDAEHRDLEDLRARLEDYEASSPDRISRDLAKALRLRSKERNRFFDELVEALQPGTEAAIERSVAVDKSRLSGSLFPIMGPAIRSYVMELFRNLVQELNDTIRNTTSFERLKWRIQARLAGKPFSEYVILKTANYKVEELFLIERDSGILIERLSAKGAEETGEDSDDDDADLMSGMLTAIRSFARDSLGDPEVEDSGELHGFGFGHDHQVVLENGPKMYLAAVVRGVTPMVVREKLKDVVVSLHERFAAEKHALVPAGEGEGEGALVESRISLLESALMENRAKDSDGGLWRFWLLALVVLAALIAGGVFLFREAGKWDAFADALREEPGIEVIESKRWKGMVGLRDPMAREPAEVAQGHDVDPEKVSLDFKPYLSLHPEFAQRREAELAEKFAALNGKLGETKSFATAMDRTLADTQKNLIAERKAFEGKLTQLQRDQTVARKEIFKETIQSRYGHLADLKWQFTDSGVVVSGVAPEPEYSQIKKQLATLPSLGKVDVSGMTNASSDRITQLIAEISAMPVIFDSGTEDALDAELVMAQMAKLVGELKAVADRSDVKLAFTVLSHPLIGKNRDANSIIERARAAQVRARLIATAISPTVITVKLSEELDQAGNGVVVIPERVLE